MNYKSSAGESPVVTRKRPQLATRTGHKTTDRCSKIRQAKMRPSDAIRAQVDKINSGIEAVLNNKVEEKNKWWTERFDEKRGDSSKVVEITLSDDEDNSQTGKVIEIKPEMEDIKTDMRELEPKHKTSRNDISTNYYFCVFCLQTCGTCEEAKDHYLAHLGLYLECRECSKKFSSLQLFRKHNPQHIDRSKMKNLEEFMAAKKWVDNYVDNYIERHKELLKSFIFTFRMYCPVCFRIRNTLDESKHKANKVDIYFRKGKVKFTEEFVRNHLYEHFQYFPYECIDCQLEDKKTEFCLNEQARQHLLDVHNINNAFELNINQVEAYFNRRRPIKRLEVCIETCLSCWKLRNELLDKQSSKLDKTRIHKTGSKVI